MNEKIQREETSHTETQRSGFCGERRGNGADGYPAKGRMECSGVCPDEASRPRHACR